MNCILIKSRSRRTLSTFECINVTGKTISLVFPRERKQAVSEARPPTSQAVRRRRRNERKRMCKIIRERARKEEEGDE